MDSKKLIEDAASKVGSYAELSRRTGIRPQRLSNIRNDTGHVHRLTPDECALVADAMGLDALDALGRATIDANVGTEKGARLEAALGKSRRAIGVAASWLMSAVSAASLAAVALSVPSTPAEAGTANRADVSTVRRLLALIMRSVNSAPRLLHRRYHRTAIGTA